MNHHSLLGRAATGILIGMAVLILGSCKTRKLIYLEDMPTDRSLPITNNVETHIKPGDRLSILVSCTKQELALPFNNISYDVSTDGTTTSSGSRGSEGYLVDDEGCIDFPTLGRLQVGGLTLAEVKDFVRGLLIEGQHVPDAVVDAHITNFTVYGLGALSPGRLTVPEAKINILQAVAQMSDLQGHAKYDKVRVIREEDGQRMEFDLDMTSTDIFRSPAFNLQQNDIVYAEPKKRSSNATNKATIWISLLATLASIAYSITYILK